MNIDELKIAHRINERLHSIVRRICSLVDDHDDGSYPHFTWEIYDDTISLQVTTREMHNRSCHCHPEWEIDEHTSYHDFPLDDLLNDNWFNESDEATGENPFLDRLETGIREKARLKKEADAKAQADKLAREQAADKKRELAELERLAAKYR